MSILRGCCLLAVVLFLLAGCKPKKKPSLSGEGQVAINDFIDFFPVRTLPYQFTDSSLEKMEEDSLLISYKVFTQFVDDSVAGRLFGKGVKPKLYAMARVKAHGGENYLFIKSLSGDKREAFVFAFGKKNKLTDGLSVLRVDQNSSTQQSASIDKSYSVNKIITRKNPDGSISDGKDVYSLNTENGKFTLIMTDALDATITELVNPIDTLRRKNKYSADYGTGKMNLVSIRDGRKSDRLSFFIHFDKSNGTCTGELRGEAIIKSASLAEYRQGGDPCVLQFIFTPSSVTVKELEGCGSHRGLRCSFDGTFPRKKEPKSKGNKKKTTLGK
ncbi:MAG: hypothetical protein Q8941_14945 [Bacteroidota bacterium]|nr:hypothetical protein [Bacteroidota bacterium]